MTAGSDRTKFMTRMGQAAFAGLALLLGMALPLWAATSSTPCNATGALGATMGGCAKPPTSPPSGPGSGLSRGLPVFSAPMRFRVATTKPSPDSEIRRNVASWVAKKILPRPTSNESALLSSAVRSLVLTRFPVDVAKAGTGLYSVTVDATTLNQIASDLSRALSSGRLSYRVNRIAVAGGSEKENRFVEKNLPISPDGVVDAQEVSDTLYAIGQIPGFTRADGIFAPVPDLNATAPQSGTPFAPTSPSPALENLFVHVQPTPTFSGSQLEVDNYGYAPTGALLLNATGNANNVGAAGGLFTVVATTSFGGMNSGTLSYSVPVNLMMDDRVGIDLAAMNYTLGLGFSPWGHGANAGQLAALGVSGSNYSGDAWATQTFIQKPDGRLALKETVFLKEFQDTYSQTSQNDRSLVGGILDLSGFKTLGQLTGSLDLSDTEYFLQQGSASDPANPFYNDTQGLQNYVTGNGSLRYTLTPVWSVTLGGILQQYFGGGTLDPMLQATLGGVSNVMVLPTASLFGNDLYAGTLTLTRTDAAKAGIFASSLFFDAGQVTGLGTNYSAMGPGVEESVSATHWFARADLAVPVGALPTQALGQSLTALTGDNIGQGGIPLQLWLSAGLRY